MNKTDLSCLSSQSTEQNWLHLLCQVSLLNKTYQTCSPSQSTEQNWSDLPTKSIHWIDWLNLQTKWQNRTPGGRNTCWGFLVEDKALQFRPTWFLERLLCIAVEAGLEKRRYLLFASPGAAKSLVSAAFFTERERPAETVMHKRRIVFSMAWTVTTNQGRTNPARNIDWRYNTTRL